MVRLSPPGAQLLKIGNQKAFCQFPSLEVHPFNELGVKSVFPGKSWLQRALDGVNQDSGHGFTA